MAALPQVDSSGERKSTLWCCGWFGRSSSSNVKEPLGLVEEAGLVDNSCGDELYIESQVRQFSLREQELQPLTLDDVKILLDLLSHQVHSLLSTGTQSSANALLGQTLSKYDERKESLNSFITSLPQDLLKEVAGGSKDVLMPLLTKTLGGVGNLHWVGLGLRVIAWSLDTVQSTMQNREESIQILKSAIDLIETIAQIWEQGSRNHNDTTNPKLQDIIEKAFRCAIVCTSHMNSSVILRFVDAARVKQAMADLKQELRDAKGDAMLYMQKEKFGASKVYSQIKFSSDSSDDEVGEVITLAMEVLRKDSNDLLALCLFGMGGIGKSYRGLKIFQDFQKEKEYKTCRVELELDIAGNKQLVDIQKQILGKLWECPASNIFDCTEGRDVLAKELKKMSHPVFLYLDNILELAHVEEILPKASCFPKGSKLLVTSRNADIENGMKRLGIEKPELMEVKKLEDEEAVRLLWKQVTSEDKKHREVISESDHFKKLEGEVVKQCDGLPLALKMVGRYIGNHERGATDVGVWQDVVNAMKKAVPLSGSAHDELYSRIRFSIESLDAGLKSAFLDIVSFSDGSQFSTSWEVVERLVDSLQLRLLLRRCLVQKTQPKSLNGSSLLKVHDVILALARKMINDDNDDLRITGTNRLRQLRDKDLKKVVALKELHPGAPMQVEARMLKQMPRLRFLRGVSITVEGESCEEAAQLRGLSVVDDLTCTGTGKFLNWKECVRLKHLSGWYGGAELYASDLEFLRHQNVSEALEVLVLEDWLRLTDVGVLETLRCLKRLSLIRCSSLSCLPQGVGGLSSLKRLDLSGCGRLQGLPEGVSGLTSLETLELGGCKGLEMLPEGIAGLSSLKSLGLGLCERLQGLPEGVSGLRSLETLQLNSCKGLEMLPEGIAGLSSLKRLGLGWCERLQGLPEGVSGLTSLETLQLSNCIGLEMLPEGIAGLSSLKRVDLSDCKRLQSLPEGVSDLRSLETLELGGCKGLEMLPEGIAGLSSLKLLGLNRCERLQGLPEGVSGLTSLESLQLGFCKGLEMLPEGITGLSSLKWLDLRSCERLQGLPGGIASCTCLRTLRLSGCSSLQSLPEGIKGLKSLSLLDLGMCKQLQCLSEILEGLIATSLSLGEISLRECSNLQMLPAGFSSLRSLKIIDLRGCTGLQFSGGLHELKSLAGLEFLALSSCEALHALMQLDQEEVDMSMLGRVTHVEVSWSQGLPYLSKSLPSFTNLKELTFDGDGVDLPVPLPKELTSLTALQTMRITKCKSVRSLPSGFTSLQSLKKLTWYDCRSLQSLQELAGLTGLEELALEGCPSQEHAMLEAVWTLTGLWRLALNGWENIQALPEGIACLTRLTWLSLKECRSLLWLPAEVSSLSEVKIKLAGCTSLEEKDPTLLQGGSNGYFQMSELPADHPNLFQAKQREEAA